MRLKTKIKTKVLALVLTIAALAAGHVSATAQVGTFTVTNTSGSTFTITRTTNTEATEKVMYRTVSLSAIAGTHFTAASGTLTFDADNNTRTVTVTESGSAADAYKYQTAASRQYRFEVTDLGGTVLASKDRSITSGLTQFSGAKVSSTVTNLVTMSSGNFSSGMASGKYLDVSYTPPTSQVETSGTLSGYVLIDDEYDYAQKPATVSTATLIGSTGAPASYLSTLGYKIYATVCFTEKEKDDGYQYLQIVAGTASSGYDTGADPNGAVNDPANSVYKVCFEFANGSNAEGKIFFPHRYTSNGEFSNSAGVLHQQKYKSDDNWTYDGSGAVVLPVTTGDITTRFDAGGNNNDTWGYKDFFVRMALRDATAPTKSGAPVVAPGPYGAGTTVYISVPFSEIVTVSGTPYLHTDWGDYNYFSGSGSNVLTFSGTIPATFGATLITRSLSGTITDLAGNALASTDCYKQFSSITVALPWGGSGTQADPYVITRAAQLDYMATRVNANYGADSFNGKYFVLADDIAYSHTIDWNTYSGASSTTENNFTPIGRYGRSFQGHFDGQGHTISGIRVWTEYTLTDNTNESLGLFGFVSGGSVSNVVLRDANIRGLKNLGGIVGYLSGGSVTNCTLYQVLVGSHAKANMATGMGIVAGYVGGTVTDCYYRDCIKGLTYQDGSNDITIMPHPERWDNVYTITTATGVGATYDSGTTITIDDATYYAEGCTFNLAYSGTIETAKVQDGYTNTYTITEGLHTFTYHDYIDATLTLPAADCTVSVRFASAWTGSGTSEAPYVITTPAQLDLLAKMVGGQGGYGYSDFDGVCFQLEGDITYTHTSDWDDATSTENNYTAIGGWRSGTTYNQFKGGFDGDGHTISGIRIYKPESSTGNGYTGLFGYVGTGGSIHDVNLADARITGQLSVAGIAGLSYGTVTNCTVAADVLVASKNTNAHYHAGIVGNNHGTVSGCTSAVTLTAAYTSSDDYAAVVGINYSEGTIENCLALGATIPVMQDYYGVIVGYNSSGTLTANYYRDCTVGSTANAVGVGAGKSGGAPNDVDGARSVHNLTLPDGVTATGESVEISGTTYYAAATTVTLANSETAPSGYIEPCYYNFDGTNISGNTVTMPASDATVGTLWTLDYETGHAGTEADPYIISDYPQLELLASRVNEGNRYSSDKFFKLGADIVCFDGENNHTPIGVHGTYQHFFGTFDGDGHTVSGIRISSSTGYQGLFGNLSGATVKNVTLAGSTIIGRDEVGGIVGYSFTGTFENCRVLGDVTIKANASSADYHGGIVGKIFGPGTVNGCYSAATVTRDGNSNCTNYGGIVGKTDGTVSNCIADGAWVIGSEESSSGAIIGTNDGGTLARNYYYGCSVKSFANNVGTGSGDVTDNDGAVKTNGIPLLDNYSNDFVLRHYADGNAHDFTLAGRTLYKDGSWNTLCLPFALTAQQVTAQLAPAALMTLSSTAFSNGTLTLNFEDATEIVAGKPYIIKWDADANLVAPTFTGVTIPTSYNSATAIDAALTAAAVSTAYADFCGTYAPANIYTADKTNLYLGTNDNLYYTKKTDFKVNAFRAYFQLNDGLTAGDPANPSVGVRTFVLNFGDGDVSGITTTNVANDTDAWYSLDGRRLSGKPRKSGVYVCNGRKTIIK